MFEAFWFITRDGQHGVRIQIKANGLEATRIRKGSLEECLRFVRIFAKAVKHEAIWAGIED